MLTFIGLYLTLTGFLVSASSKPGTLWVRLVCFVLGALLFASVKSSRLGGAAVMPVFAAFGALLMMANLLVSESIFGARSWMTLFDVTFQPSELLKVCTVFTLGYLAENRNYASSGLYALAVVLTFAAINDFGGALIIAVSYFAAAGITMISAALGAAGMIISLQSRHVLKRITAWGEAWTDPAGAGYQQTRAMTAVASGGLFGSGFRNGWLKNVAAADTDMTFAFVCEEAGLLFASSLVLAMSIIGFYAIKGDSSSRAAGALLISQTLLNAAGSFDLLPFTGLTFPFVSRGGSSLIASWGLLAFIDWSENTEKILCCRSAYSCTAWCSINCYSKIYFGRRGLGNFRI